MRYVSADVGGTFTDLVLIDAATSAVYLDKVPSSVDGSAEPVCEGIRRISAAAELGPEDLGLFVHGFTIATNAFLTRRGAKVVLVVTAGFRDVLEVATQVRPELYSLTQSKPTPVVPRSRIVEVRERIDAFGNVVTPLDQDEAARAAAAVAAMEPDAVAVCLTFSHLNPGHEQALEGALARRLPGRPIYLSSRVNPQIEEYPRANTTAVAAYIGPVVDRYIGSLETELESLGVGAPLRLMRSDGGVATPRAARDNPAHMMLSGPAGGVIAGLQLARDLDLPNLVTFDMGGTSADFSLIIDGEPRMIAGRELDGQPLRLPTLDIETISAGGGSIARVDVGGALRVGPQSAGAVPGPACYGKGGEEATITDAAVVLGLLDPAEYLGGDMSVDAALAREAVKIKVAEPLGLGLEEAAFGIVTVANAQMMQAIRTLSVERGHDVRRFALLAFGGAGPMYAAYMARDLGMAEVVVPRNPGVFAAHGLLLTDIGHTTQTPYPKPVAEVEPDDLAACLGRLKDDLAGALERDGVDESDRYFRYAADMRCVGQFHELRVPLQAPGTDGWWQPAAVAAEFHRIHEVAYGHADPRVPVEIVNLRLEAFGRMPKAASPVLGEEVEARPRPMRTVPAYFERKTGFQECPVYRRDELRPGQRLAGPALVIQRDSTVVVLSDHEGRVDRHGIIRIASKGV